VYQAHPPTSKKLKSNLQNDFTDIVIYVFRRRQRAVAGAAAAASAGDGGEGSSDLKLNTQMGCRR